MRWPGGRAATLQGVRSIVREPWHGEGMEPTAHVIVAPTLFLSRASLRGFPPCQLLQGQPWELPPVYTSLPTSCPRPTIS